MKRITRREALKLGALASGSSLLLSVALGYRGYTAGIGSPKVKPFTLPFRVPPVLQPVRSDATTDYYELKMCKASIEILPGKQTLIWGYNGIFPGPTIKQRQDRQSVIRFINDLGTSTSVHLNGMASLPQYDGYAQDLTPPGYYKDYIYPNNRAATMWYHDHAIHETAHNVYMGLAGMYLVQDDLELDLPLPKGDYDVPLFLMDKIFADNGEQIFDDQGKTSLMGDVITVNGVQWPRMEVANRKYRFRLLNGSISRAYNLALSTGDNFIMIGTDGGLMSEPIPTKNFRIAMAERYEFIIDFSKYPLGTQVVLQNLQFPTNNYDGTNQIMRFDVVREESDDSSIPSKLRHVEAISTDEAVRFREFRYDWIGGVWTINAKTWEKNRVDGNPQLGDVEIWRLSNNTGGWFHPIHLHLIDCQILDRNGNKPFPYERGWKDVFYVGENESVRVIGKFGPHTGLFMSHCHNAVHEDYDMMNQFQVGQGGSDPMSAPAQPLPAPPL